MHTRVKQGVYTTVHYVCVCVDTQTDMEKKKEKNRSRRGESTEIIDTIPSTCIVKYVAWRLWPDNNRADVLIFFHE